MITGEEMTKLLEAWRQAFWYFREDVGIGDSFEIEYRRLEKNLLKLFFGFFLSLLFCVLQFYIFHTGFGFAQT